MVGKERESLVVGAFTPKIEAALMALGELLETLSASPHPQEFGMDGCPICKARDAIGGRPSCPCRTSKTTCGSGCPMPDSSLVVGRDLTFVDLGDGMVEVRREGATWNGLPGVYDRFALYGGDSFEAGVADYLADTEAS